MLTALRKISLAAVLVTLNSTALASDAFTVAPVHSSVSFMIAHQGISLIHGRFNQFSGKFTIDRADPTKSSFALSIKVESVDTNNQVRDEHLRAPDYFDIKQFPEMTFQSTKVKAIEGGYEVAGDLKLHGVTKNITLVLKGGDKEVEFPKGTQRIGVATTPVINRSDFDMKAALPALGDEVQINIGLEAVKN